MSGHKKAVIAKNFTDAGTGERFKKGDTPMIPSAAYANYEAAGLVGVPPAAKAAAKPATPKKRPSAKKAKPSQAATAAQQAATATTSAADSAVAPNG